jgi:ABC-2 type transport system ATP-binding protein
MSAENNGAVAAFTELTVCYGKTIAVDGVSLAVKKGDVYALLGRNGSGKTSMIRCLLGQMKACAGSASLFGWDAWEGRAAAMGRVGVVPESPDMPPALNALELANFCSRFYPRWDGKGVTARLEHFGIPEKVPFGRLSRGQKNQLALALALAPLPDLLVLDDPTLGLDAVARKEFFEELVGDLADRGTTVMVTTHDLNGIEGIASRVGILKIGRLLLDEEMETLKSRFRAVRWTGAALVSSDLPSLVALSPVKIRSDAWGGEIVVRSFDEAALARLAQDLSPAAVEASSLSLEELFIAMVGEEGGLS